jgi:hypothetical protein
MDEKQIWMTVIAVGTVLIVTFLGMNGPEKIKNKLNKK